MPFIVAAFSQIVVILISELSVSKKTLFKGVFEKTSCRFCDVNSGFLKDKKQSFFNNSEAI